MFPSHSSRTRTIICLSMSPVFSRMSSLMDLFSSGRRRLCLFLDGFDQLGGDVAHDDLAALRHEDEPLDEVLQLPDVSRPVVVPEKLHDLRIRPGDLPVELAVEFIDKVAHERGDVLLALPQRRDVDRHDVEPVEEVLPEETFLHILLEVAVRGGHEPHVHLDRLDAAHPFELVILDHPQELYLHLPGKIADLVQEQRPLVGQLEAPRLARHGPREGALFVAEQFALDEVFGDRRAVDLDEGVELAGAVDVDGIGHEFLARPRLAGDEDARRGGGDFPDDIEDLRHGRARAHDLAAVELRGRQAGPPPSLSTRVLTALPMTFLSSSWSKGFVM